MKPEFHPILTSFCIELTGITHKVIDTKGVSFSDAFKAHADWLAFELGVSPSCDNVIFVTCGYL